MRGVLTLGNSFPESPPAFPVCFNEFFQLGLCGSSIRFKENVNPFTPGLNLVKRLRPVSFDWKKSGIPDLGLVAEEVADVEPLLVTHDDKGQIQGVKYDRLGVLLINAVNELKAEKDAQISALKSENAALRQHNAALDARISAIELKMKKELVANRTATRRPRRNGAR